MAKNTVNKVQYCRKENFRQIFDGFLVKTHSVLDISKRIFAQLSVNSGGLFDMHAYI